MVTFLIVVHIFVCLVLIAVILLQAGRGGGLSDIAGNQPQSILGTQTNSFMTRATEVCAVIFILTSLTLGIISTQKGKSLMQNSRMVEALKQSIPAEEAATIPGTQVPSSVETVPAVETVKTEAPVEVPATVPAS